MQVLLKRGMSNFAPMAFVLLVYCHALPQSSLLTGSIIQARTVPRIIDATASNGILNVKQIQKTIPLGGHHTYTLRLASGQYLRAVVEEKNTDLRISLFGAGRNKLTALDNRRFGPTSISWVVDAPGLYRLELKAVRAGTNAGNYKLSVEVRQSASAADMDAIAAEKLFSEGEEISRECRPNFIPSSISKYEEAIELWRNGGRLEEVAFASRELAAAHMLLGQNERSLEYYNEALQMSRSTGNRLLEIEALNGIGFVENDRGAPSVTLEYCGRARSLSQEIGYRRGEAQALNNIGLTYYNGGDMRQALSLFEQSLAVWATASDRGGQAQTLLNIGYAYDDLGETAKGRDYFDQALSLARKTKDYRTQVLSLAALGLAYIWSGKNQKAADSYKEALGIAQLAGDRFGQAVSLNGIGYYYDDLGEEQTALENYLQAARLFGEVGNQNYESFTLGYAAHIYLAMGDKDKAMEYYKRQLDMCRSMSNKRLESYSLRDMGAVYTSLGNLQEALAHYEPALELSRQVGDLRGQAYLLNRLGLVHSQMERPDRAQECFNEALPLIRYVEDNSGEILTLYNMARLKKKLGELEEASRLIQTALQMVERLRANVISKDLRASYLASVYQCYELYIDLLMQRHRQDPEAGHDRTAFLVSERGRARSLLEILTKTHADIRRGISPGLLQKARSLQQLLNAKADRYTRLRGQSLPVQGSAGNGDSNTDEEFTSLSAEIKELTRRLREVEERIKIWSPQYAALTQPELLPLRDLQKLLDSNTLLLEYSLGEERSYVWAVTNSLVISYELPPREDIERLARDFYGSIASQQKPVAGETYAANAERVTEVDARMYKSANLLSRMILEPLASHLGTRRLVIVADGALQYVPFAALIDPRDLSGKAFLVVNHEISSLPSLSTLAVLRREFARRKKAAKTLMILADPVYEKNDARVRRSRGAGNTDPSRGQVGLTSSERASINPANAGVGAGLYRLPFTGREAREISRFTPRSKRNLALDFNANRRTAMSAKMSEYRIIHFATHGYFDDKHPELSGIVLSLVDEKGNSQDGLLQLDEVYNMKLRADMVVLSACQTALGKEIKGEGLIGLMRGFMYAGAPRVSATLWRVDDNATSQLMKQFYYEMLKRNRLKAPAALRAAQLRMLEQPQWRSPYFWAAFILQGEWN